MELLVVSCSYLSVSTKHNDITGHIDYPNITLQHILFDWISFNTCKSCIQLSFWSMKLFYAPISVFLRISTILLGKVIQRLIYGTLHFTGTFFNICSFYLDDCEHAHESTSSVPVIQDNITGPCNTTGGSAGKGKEDFFTVCMVGSNS